MNSKRTLVIGDIHSGFKGLKQVLDRAKITKDDLLIFLGDYVDGWSEAVETVDFLIKLNKTHNCIFLKGNHDELCFNWLLGDDDNPMWMEHGGKATMDSYDKATKKKIESHMTFYSGLKKYYIDDKNRLFLHAGFTSLKGVQHEYVSKTFYWDRTLWELAVSLNPNLSPKDGKYPSLLKLYDEIYIGHTPVSRLGKCMPLKAANVWNIDTGAAFKGVLSAMDIDTKEVWQSEPLQTLYPNERGRN